MNMNIPSLKKVNIAKGSKIDLFDQLALVNFSSAPVAINISHLEDQERYLEFIEEYINENEIRLIPYPICVLVKDDLYSEKLLIIKKLKGAPNFYNQKIKPLNLKENALLKRISLLQNKIKNNNIAESQNVFKNYARYTKEVDLLDRQGKFINKIILRGNEDE